MKQNKILVIRGGAIGDFILTLPVFGALREMFPATRLEVLGYPHIARLAVTGGLCEDMRSIDARPLASFFARNGKLDADLSAYFSSFAIIISYLYDPDQIFQNNLRSITASQLIHGPHRPSEQEDVHATEVFLKPLETLAIFGPDHLPRLDPQRFLANGTDYANYVCFHPGSGSERKNWPEAKWRDLALRVFAETKFNVVLVGGEAEGERLQRLAAALPADRVKVLRNQPLNELAGVIGRCRAFAGHDSGITHLASALGLPCVVVWSDTKKAIWQPRHANCQVVDNPFGVTAVEVERVWAVLKSVLRT